MALVIGNGAYANAPRLKNPPNDATDIAAALSKVGFDVEHGINSTQRQMKIMIREFGKRLRNGGQGLFYFAGHGVQLRGRNYLIPIDADIQNETDVEDQAVDVNLLLGLMDEAGNGLNVVILDACRNNPFALSFRSTTNGLAQVDAPTGTLIAYATAPGRVARDGTGRNGTYTAELLRQIEVPRLPVEELLKRVRANVKQKTNGEQVPWESSSLVGDFYFNSLSNPGAASKIQTNETLEGKSNPALVEQEYWESIKSSTNSEDFRDYLKEYPTGLHSVIARSNLRRLGEEVRRDNIEGDAISASNSKTGAGPPATSGAFIKHFAKDGLSFDYLNGWSVVDESTSDAQQLSLGREDSEALIKLFVHRGKVNSPEKLAQAKEKLIDPYIEYTSKQFVGMGAKPERAAATAQIGGATAEGVRITAVIDREPGEAGIYWTTIGERLVVLTFFGPDKARNKATPIWDAVRNSLKVEPPAPKATPKAKPIRDRERNRDYWTTERD